MNSIRLKYSALFEMADDGINIRFPDLPQCISCAFTKKDSSKMAKDVMGLYLHGINLENIPERKYPIKYYSSKKAYVRTISHEFEVKDNCLVCEYVIKR